MNIGIAGQIARYEEDSPDGIFDWALINHIIDDSDLQGDTKKSWINHLLETDPDKYELDENSMYWFDDNNFDYLTPLPNGHSWNITPGLSLVKEDGQWLAAFDNWSDWSELFMNNQKVSHVFIVQVLMGDAYNFFDVDPHMSEDEIANFIKGNLKQIKSWSYLEDLYIEEGGEEDRGNVEKTISVIYSDEKFEEIKRSIDNALMSADMSAREGEAFKNLKEAIVDHFELGTEEYLETSEVYKVNTTITGADKLAKASKIGSDNYIDYLPPRDDYWAEMDPTYFSEELENNLGYNVS